MWKTSSVEYDSMINSLSFIINLSLSLCDCMQKKNKLFTMISQQVNEQKKKWTYFTDMYTWNNVYYRIYQAQLHPEIAIMDVFNALYNERKTIESGNYIYKI